MRVSINGGRVRELDRGLARRLRVGKAVEVAEGEVLSLEQALAKTRRGMRIVYGALVGLAAVISLAAIAAAAAYEPADLAIVAPLGVVGAVFLALMVRWVFGRNLEKVRLRAEAQLACAPAGSAVRVDAAGLTIGGSLFAWPLVEAEEVGVAAASSGDTTDYSVDRLSLLAAGQTVVLDAVAIDGGAAVVSQAWRRLQASAAQ